MAEETVFLTVSAILAVFDVLPYENKAMFELPDGIFK